MPQMVDFDGREATPIPPERWWRSAARSHPAGVAGINRNRWPVSAGLGGRFRPERAGGEIAEAVDGWSVAAREGVLVQPKLAEAAVDMWMAATVVTTEMWLAAAEEFIVDRDWTSYGDYICWRQLFAVT